MIYGRETRAGGLARQAAIMNEARRPDLKITSLSNLNQVSNLTDFFKSVSSKEFPNDSLVSPERKVDVVISKPSTPVIPLVITVPDNQQKPVPVIIPNPYGYASVNTMRNHNIYNPYNTSNNFGNYGMRPFYPSVSSNFFIPPISNVETAQKPISVTPQNHTVTNYNGPVTINNYNGNQVENPYKKKKVQTCSAVDKLKSMDKDLFDLVENNHYDDIFEDVEDDICLITSVVPGKNDPAIIDRIVQSNEKATRSFFGEFSLPDNCGESFDSEINKLPLTHWENDFKFEKEQNL